MRGMKKDKPESDNSDDLRCQVVERLKDSQSGPFDPKSTDVRDAMAMVHELQVHQIEPEM